MQKMANLAGNFSLKVMLRLQNGVFPGVKKNGGAISCLASRDYGSSMPTRYIPKKSSDSSKPEIAKVRGPVGNEISGNPNPSAVRFGVSDVARGRAGKNASFHKEPQSDNGNPPPPPKSSLMFNSMPMSDLEEETGHDEDALDAELLNGTVELAEEIEIPRGRDIDQQGTSEIEKTRKDVEHKAIQLLATRAFTIFEMKKKLQTKKFPSSIIDDVVDDLRKRGLINDSMYAEAYSQSRWSSSCWGPRRIKHELYKKGVDRVDVDKAVKVVFEGDNSNSSCDKEEPSGLGLSKDSLDHLFVQASKQWMRSEGVAAETRKARIIRWLQYRGFNWSVTNLILRKLESQHNS